MNIFEFIQGVSVLFDDSRDALEYITQNNQQDIEYEYSSYDISEESIKKENAPMNIFEFIQGVSVLFDDSRDALENITQNNQQDIEY